MKIVIYSAIFGEKDIIKPPLNFKKDDNIDYYFITDNDKLIVKGYKTIFKKPIFEDITKNARYYKLFGLELFKDYDFVIWHDGNIQINHDKIFDLVKFCKDFQITFFKHPNRNCVYTEALKCIQLEKDFPFIILKQIIGYFKAGLKNRSGLFATGIYIKNNRVLSDLFLKAWWKEIKNKSRRDQISLTYVLKKMSIKYNVISDDIRNNKYSIFFKHNHSNYNYLSKKNRNVNPLSKIITSIIIKIIIRINEI